MGAADGVVATGAGGVHGYGYCDDFGEKKQQKLEYLNVVCSGERAGDPPQVWTKFEPVYQLRGKLDHAAVKHAIELSEGEVLFGVGDAEEDGDRDLAV